MHRRNFKPSKTPTMKKSTLQAALLLSFFLLYTLSCQKKNEALHPLLPTHDYEFLRLSPSSPAVLHRIANRICQQNLSAGFLPRIQEEEGIPVWGKSVISSLSPTDNNTDTLVLVPLVIKNHKQVSGFLVCKAGRENVDIIDLVRTRFYEAYGFDNTVSKVTANTVVLQSLSFDQKIFGDSVFRIKDNRLFNSKASKRMESKEETITVTPVKANVSASNRLIQATQCYTVTHEGDKGNLTGTAPGESNNYYWTEEICYVHFIYFPDPVIPFPSGGGSIPFPSGVSSNQPLGSSGSASALATVNWYDGCKDGKVLALQLPGNAYKEISCGATIQPYEPKPKLELTYNLTEEDQRIINQIKEEDEMADEILNTPPPCYGTHAMGNINRNGTLQHWLIQYDYLATHPNSFREYSIPESSKGGVYRGRADIVNLNSYEIFEIKPKDLFALGAEEVANYIDKANKYCSPSISGGNKKWTAGVLYESRVLPYPPDPTKQLTTELNQAGVIIYKLVQKNTVPFSVVVPKNVLDKIKDLLKELKKDMDNLEEKILVYLRDNPEIVNYIKAAAVGAAITIIVGTIVEDIITFGAGVADDWASFLMAYKLVRIARLL